MSAPVSKAAASAEEVKKTQPQQPKGVEGWPADLTTKDLSWKEFLSLAAPQEASPGRVSLVGDTKGSYGYVNYLMMSFFKDGTGCSVERKMMYADPLFLKFSTHAFVWNQTSAGIVVATSELYGGSEGDRGGRDVDPPCEKPKDIRVFILEERVQELINNKTFKARQDDFEVGAETTGHAAEMKRRGQIKHGLQGKPLGSLLGEVLPYWLSPTDEADAHKKILDVLSK